MAESIELGFLTIDLPTASDARFHVMHDLAGAFGLEFNADAVERLRAAWKAGGRRGRLGIDHEADFVFVDAGRDAILEAAVLIHELAGKPLPPAEVELARAALARRRRPKAKPWRVGDLFALPLGDGTFGFGQVLGDWPSCSLVELRAPSPAATPEAVLAARRLAILHVQRRSLDDGRWIVVGHASPAVDPFSGPCGHPYQVGGISWDGLEELAGAWWGLTPWNRYDREDYLDEYLLAGVGRSPRAVLLSPDERAAVLREARGETA